MVRPACEVRRYYQNLRVESARVGRYLKPHRSGRVRRFEISRVGLGRLGRVTLTLTQSDQREVIPPLKSPDDFHQWVDSLQAGRMAGSRSRFEPAALLRPTPLLLRQSYTITWPSSCWPELLAATAHCLFAESAILPAPPRAVSIWYCHSRDQLTTAMTLQSMSTVQPHNLKTKTPT